MVKLHVPQVVTKCRNRLAHAEPNQPGIDELRKVIGLCIDWMQDNFLSNLHIQLEGRRSKSHFYGLLIISNLDYVFIPSQPISSMTCIFLG